MAAVIFTNLSGYVFGVPADETTLNVTKVTFKRSGEKLEIKKRAGGYAGRIDHTYKWVANISGELKGSWAGVVGGICTIANATAFGITGGAWVIDDFNIDAENSKAATLSITATGYDSDDSASNATQSGVPGTLPTYGVSSETTT